MENVVESQVQVFEPQSPIESSSDYGPVIKDSVMNVYNVEGNVSQEMATELIKSQNIKTSLDLEAARHATLQDEVKNSELKKAETEKALELEKVRKENLKEERTVHELQLKTEKIEREKADVERNTRHQTEEKEKQLVKEAEIKVLRDRVKNEVTDLRVFEQRELKIQSLDCVDGDGLGAFHISEMIEKKKVWAGMPITVSDGSTVTIASLILKHTSLQMADLIEPMNSNSIATLTIKDNFKISISTPLRGGEEYVVFFGSKDIISIINSDGENPTLVKSLIEYLSEPSFFNENTLKRVEEALKLQGRLRENINFSERVYARIEEKLLAELDNQVNTTMKDYSFVVKDGKTTFMGKKGANVIPYTEKALLQTLRGKKIVMVHPITRKETTYYPAELWVKNEMYKIYDGTVYYPSDSYEGVEYNINCGNKCKFHSHPSTHFTLTFPPVSQTCFQSFHFYLSTFGQFCEMNRGKWLANVNRLI